MSILLITKPTEACREAQRFLRALAPDCVVLEGERTDAMPDLLRKWSGDYLFSFVGPWIVPAAALTGTRQAAWNFHPGPPAYPGIGCYNFALYDEAAEYGVTCHEMAPAVDTGRIVRVVRFPVFPEDTVALLKERSMAYLLVLFYDVVGALLKGVPPGVSDERWTRQPYTRQQLDALCRLDHGMSAAEIRRRVRATTFPGAPGPYFEDGSPLPR
ncbi:MAG: formyltransferase family protein [Vicinamibacterales bacterium]